MVYIAMGIDPKELLKQLGIREKRLLDGEERAKFLFWLELANPAPFKESVGLHNWEFYYDFDGIEYVVTHTGDHNNEVVTVEELGPYIC